MTMPRVTVLASLAVAVATALVAGALVDIGTRGLARMRARFTEHARFDLRELFLFIEPQRLFLLGLGATVLMAAAAGLATSSWFAAGAAAAGGALLPRAALRLLRRRRLAALEQQLPDALLILAGGLRAGASLTQGLQQLVAEMPAPLSQELDLLLREQRLGVALDEALEHLHRRVPLATLTLAVSAMRIATETGGHLAETLERTAQTLRSQLAMEAKIRALTAQGKLQAVVVGALPVVLIAVLQRMEPQAMGLLFSTPVGWATLAVILLLEASGIVVIRKIVDIDV
jgi:tight adherence protein B